jgi:DNA uptake protein ComE-like DNA-binding protein
MASPRFVVLPASLCLAWGLAFSVPSPARAEAKSASKTKTAKVDINSATEAELEALPGVGPATAEKIVAGRPYASVADLEKAGVSAKTIEQIKPLVTARKPKATASAKTKTEKADKPEKAAKAEKPDKTEKAKGTAKTDSTAEASASDKAGSAHEAGGKAHTKTAKVNLNTATEQELEDLPGVGPATAQKIVAGRPYSSVADLSKAGVTARTIEEIKPLVTASKPKTPAVAKSEKTPTTAPHEERTKSAPKAEAKSSAKAETEDDATPARTPPRPGLVWVNTESKIFHREGDHWYGRTKKGEWMTEDDALKAGYRPVKEAEKKENP